jgi:phosphotriesterase-related protein
MSKTVVNTVLGPVSSANLGTVLTHEHLIFAAPGYETDSTFHYNREERLRTAIDALTKLKAAGISTFVDATPIDVGRQVDFMADASKGSGVNIICATGLYTEHGRLPGFPIYYKLRRMEEIAEIYIEEITNGIGSRKIKPGVIKCATGGPKEFMENERKAFVAAARAHKATGVPITTHTTLGLGLEQLDLLESEGVDPRRVIIGHGCYPTDMAYHLKILQRGAFIGLDRIGGFVSDELVAAMIIDLVSAGYGGQILISHDHVLWRIGYTFKTLMPDWTEEEESQWRWTYIPETLLPKLKRFGVSDETIRTILVENPRRFFEGR